MTDRRLAIRARGLRCWHGLLRLRQQVVDGLDINRPIDFSPQLGLIAASVLAAALLIAWRFLTR